MMLAIPGQSDTAPLKLTGLSDAGLAQPAEASLNALIAITGGLITYGPVPDDPDFGLTFLALHELRMRTIKLLNKAEDRTAPP